MSMSVIILYLFIQFVVQYMFYNPVKNFLFKIHSKYRKTISWIKIEFFIVNLIVSLAVLLFTGRGGMTGMTNTFASVILGIVMYIDYNFYVRDIISGEYYKKQKEEEFKKKRQKEILNGIKAEDSEALRECYKNQF